MTTETMSAYARAVAEHAAGIFHLNAGAAASCPECLKAHGIEDTGDIEAMQEQMIDEGNFSWSPCDCCGSRLGGDRYAAHGWDNQDIAQDNSIHLDICTDCVFYTEYGDEPTEWSAEVPQC